MARSKKSKTTGLFAPFPNLPFELRREIWLLCVPLKRLIETDFQRIPVLFQNDREVHGPSTANLITPIIAHVCREARGIVRENQHPLDVKTPHSILAPWRSKFAGAIQTDTDYEELQQENPIHVLALKNFDRWTHREDIKSIFVKCNVFLGSYMPQFYRPSVYSVNLQPLQKRLHRLERGKTLYAVRNEVTLHATAKAAAHSGLFGRLGEEPIQILDHYDITKYREFRNFYLAECQHGIEDEVIYFSKQWNLEKYCRFLMALKQTTEYQWLSYNWRQDPAPELNGIEKPASWFDIMNSDESMKDSYWKMEIPWVRIALSLMPQYKPVVIIRLCTLQCTKR